jgi:hypothetical protein
MFIEIEPMEKIVQNINGEDQYKEVIKLLKELPKIKAPDNFELNLMTRIHNKNFEIERDKPFEFTLWGFLKPAAIVTITAVIVFFVIDLNSIDNSNPLLTEPEPMGAAVSEQKNEQSLQKEFIFEELADMERKEKDETVSAIVGAPSAQVKNQAYKVVINENDVISKEILELPLDDKSVDIDSRLRKSVHAETGGDFLTVGSGEQRRPIFDGFHTRSIESEWIRDSLAKYVDSLRNERIKSMRK